MNATTLPNKTKIQVTYTCSNTPEHNSLKQFMIKTRVEHLNYTYEQYLEIA